jgi:hypothetical protein
MMFSHSVQVSVPAPARKVEAECSGMVSGATKKWVFGLSG